MDPFNNREGEEEMLDIIRRPRGGAEDGGAEDGSQFLNDSGPRMELERREEAQTSPECDNGSKNVGTSQVY